MFGPIIRLKMPEACGHSTTINKPATTSPFLDTREKNDVASDILNFPNSPSQEGLGERQSVLGGWWMTFP